MIAHDPLEHAALRILRRARTRTGAGSFQVGRVLTACDMETNRGGDEWRELDAAKAAITLLLVHTSDLDDDVCVRAVVHEVQAVRAPYRVAHVAHRAGRVLPGLIRRCVPGGG